jgi:ADP-ribose pyrophosphatase YjhB (NUDIX family)
MLTDVSTWLTKMPILPIDYCPSCGKPTKLHVPDGDNRERAVCKACDTIHYQNPKIVAGALPVWEDKILLCKRAIEPRYGTWTLPAGFMENGETVEQGAKRETLEEAEADLINLSIYTMLSIPRISQVYIIFRADLTGPNAFGVGSESLETALFSEHEIPWDDIAFPMIERSLRYYFKDRKHGQFGVYIEDM